MSSHDSWEPEEDLWTPEELGWTPEGLESGWEDDDGLDSPEDDDLVPAVDGVVELLPAYSWTCEECGLTSHTSVTIETGIGDDAEDLILDITGAPPESDGAKVNIMTTPRYVECECGAAFSVVIGHYW